MGKHLTKLYPKMYPDSKIAQIVHCSRKETTSISNKTLAPKLKGYSCGFMKVLPYSLVNVSNDNSVKTKNAKCTLTFDVNCSKTVEFCFFNMCTKPGEYYSTGRTLYHGINPTLNKQEIRWAN